MASPITLTVRKLIPAGRHKVFAAWVTPAIMNQAWTSTLDGLAQYIGAMSTRVEQA